MENSGDESAAKFISALIKSVQTLCHGYLEFQNGIEIIGHINLNVDKGSSLDYILKEKVCKNAENSTLFISNSFHAEPKQEQEVLGKQAQTGNQTVQNSDVTDSGDGSRVSSAISSISSNLTGIRDRPRGSYGAKDSNSSHSHHRTGKRRASSDQSGDVCPAKVPSHHDGSHLCSDSPYRPSSGSPVDSKLGLQNLHTADHEASETMLPQTANVPDNSDIGVNLAGSVLEPVENRRHAGIAERDDDSDGDLEVTFIKEEYVEGERGACDFDSSGQQYIGGPHDRNSEGMPDPSVFPVALHSSSAPSTYVPSAHDPGAAGQQYPGGGPSQPQPGPSGTRGPVWPLPLTRRRGGNKTAPNKPLHHKTFVCDLCSVAFSSQSAMQAHGRTAHAKRFPYICSVCEKGFTIREQYRDHVNMHNNVQAHFCPGCSRPFTFKSNLRKHLRRWRNHPNRGGASRHYASYTQQQSGSWEREPSHRGDGYLPVSTCSPTVKDERNEDMIVVDEFGAPFSRIDYLDALTDGEQCKFCGADVNSRGYGGLSNPASLDASVHSSQHSLSHSGVPFSDSVGQSVAPNSKCWKCKYCEAVFTSYSELLGHTNSIHLNRQQYVCNLCGKGFSQSEHYNDHMNMHYNVKAHVCAYCSASFTYKTNLRRHLRSGVCKKYCE
ncbi:hypothetical protein ACOMHN_052554 [Nucella lapillus]